MYSLAIWGLWKQNSNKQFGEAHQNPMYYQICAEFTFSFFFFFSFIFSSMPQPEVISV